MLKKRKNPATAAQPPRGARTITDNRRRFFGKRPGLILNPAVKQHTDQFV